MTSNKFMALHISIVTPEKAILETEADEIIIPTTEGEITVLPQHVPLLSQIAPGELILKKGNTTEHIAVMGGFLEISHDKITVLSDYAVHGNNISAIKAQEAKERAERKMKEKLTEEDFAVVQAEFQKAILELKVANKIKRRSTPNPS